MSETAMLQRGEQVPGGDLETKDHFLRSETLFKIRNNHMLERGKQTLSGNLVGNEHACAHATAGGDLEGQERFVRSEKVTLGEEELVLMRPKHVLVNAEYTHAAAGAASGIYICIYM